MRTRHFLATGIVFVVLLAAPTTAVAQWPTTCVEANDAFEFAAGRLQNVGIYPRVHGAGAEAACRSDHGDNLRASFGWAFGVTVDPRPVTPIPVPEEPRIDVRLQPAWDLLVTAVPFMTESERGSTVKVRVGQDPDPLVSGRYIVDEHTIMIVEWMLAERTSAIASTMTHELSHAMSTLDWSASYENCLEEEVWAEIRAAGTWLLLEGPELTGLPFGTRTEENLFDLSWRVTEDYFAGARADGSPWDWTLMTDRIVDHYGDHCSQYG